MINYNNKIFKSAQSSENGDASLETTFHYQQSGNVLTATYSGGKVEIGHLIGIVDDHGNIDMRYHHVNKEGTLMTGKCFSKPEIQENGKIKLHEVWEWTSGDFSKGQSILEEQ